MSVTAVPSVKISDVLQGLKTTVNGLIQTEIDAKKGPMNTTLDLARDAALAIENANYAWGYSGALTQEADKADAAVQGLLEDLKKIVEDLKAKQATTSRNLQARTQQITNSLPLTSWHPKVTALCPSYMFIVNDVCEVGFTGQFRYAASKGGYRLTVQAPLLVAKDEAAEKEGAIEGSGEKKEAVVQPNTVALVGKPKRATERNLCFEVAGLSSAALEGNQCQYFQATLEVDYDGGLLTTTKTAIYNVWLATFPPSPGEIKLKYQKETITGVVKNQFRSMTMSLSREHFEKGALIERRVTVRPSGPEWRINTRPQLVCGEVMTDIEQSQWGLDFVNVKLSLPADAQQGVAHVVFEEVKDVVEDAEYVEDINLRWGQSFEFTAPAFHVAFKSFDGQEMEFTEPDQTKLYLHVVKVGDAYQLIAVPPK